jgi:hypothetical protein
MTVLLQICIPNLFWSCDQFFETKGKLQTSSSKQYIKGEQVNKYFDEFLNRSPPIWRCVKEKTATYQSLDALAESATNMI